MHLMSFGCLINPKEKYINPLFLKINKLNDLAKQAHQQNKIDLHTVDSVFQNHEEGEKDNEQNN